MNETAYATAGSRLGHGVSLGVGQAMNTIKNAQPNFADTVSIAHEKVGLLVVRLAALADRLCGTVPQDASGGPIAVPNGLLSEVMDRAGHRSVRRSRPRHDRPHRTRASVTPFYAARQLLHPHGAGKLSGEDRG